MVFLLIGKWVFFGLLLIGGNVPGIRCSYRACNADCGEKNENGRIVGGRYVTTSNEHPWMGYFTIGDEFVCACSLISDRFVLTAEHCIHFLKFLRLEEHIRVHFGSNNICKNETSLTEATSSPSIARDIIKVYNGAFSIRNLTNDIALFELAEPVQFSNEIHPIFLPTKTGSDYRFGSVIGWGRTTEYGQTSCVLKETDLPILKLDDCLKKFDAFSTHNKINNKQICTLYDSLRDSPSDACQQDSGGPLIHQRHDNSYEQIGIVSWGLGCARENSPGIYTKVSEYVDWIIDIVSNGNGCLCI